jgi:hypothetical protein
MLRCLTQGILVVYTAVQNSGPAWCLKGQLRVSKPQLSTLQPLAPLQKGSPIPQNQETNPHLHKRCKVKGTALKQQQSAAGSLLKQCGVTIGASATAGAQLLASVLCHFLVHNELLIVKALI